MRNNYFTNLKEHYQSVWNCKPSIHFWDKGPTHELPEGFAILEFEPTPPKNAWIYATMGMWEEIDSNCPDHSDLLELHLIAPERSVLDLSREGNHIELLTMAAHYHRVGAKLGLGHSVDFGRSWISNSVCTHGLISLPYLDGPKLENLQFDSCSVRCLWMVPITRAEHNFKRENGLESLELLFDDCNFNYLDAPLRESVVVS